ncbi:Uncharacterized protein TCAP_07498 [Tolypocladium capitatum]|uniref:Uncharacterized protein n=1 Tax=Tolypocladium capitatum TaxID=45235 RepID=A0A2K3PU77_9HYPO|nr:Uncharacterized protein TCAP_07498 [Tolypocladium capitatum]
MASLIALDRQSPSSASRQWTLNEVISISSDAESDVDDRDEGDCDNGSYEPEVGESRLDDLLPSISAITASIATARRSRPEGIANLAEVIDDAEVAYPEGVVSSAIDHPSRLASTAPMLSATILSTTADSTLSRHPSI